MRKGDIAKAMWDDYQSNLMKFGNGHRRDELAFVTTIESFIEKLTQESMIDRIALEHTDDDYIKHVHERNGYEIGKAINNSRDFQRVYQEEDIRGMLTRKEVFVVNTRSIREE